MLRIHSVIEKTFYPSQWTAVTDDGRPVFIHFKWGCLRVWVGEAGVDPYEILGTEPVFDDEDGDDPMEGVIDWADVVRLAGLQEVTGCEKVRA